MTGSPKLKLSSQSTSHQVQRVTKSCLFPQSPFATVQGSSMGLYKTALSSASNLHLQEWREKQICFTIPQLSLTTLSVLRQPGLIQLTEPFNFLYHYLSHLLISHTPISMCNTYALFCPIQHSSPNPENLFIVASGIQHSLTTKHSKSSISFLNIPFTVQIF